MTTRSLTGGFATALAQPHVTVFPLVEMSFLSGTVYVCGAPHDVVYDGDTYLALFGLGQIDAITETDAEVRGLALSLSGVPATAIAMALDETIQGRAITVRLAALSAGSLIVDTNVWQGLLDTMVVEDATNGATVRVTAEHRLAAWDRPRLLRYSPEDQARLAPADKFFAYVPQMAQQQIVWPGKEFFKK